MAISNLFNTFSESPTGVPIIVPSTSDTTPGTLIHTTSNEFEALWVWVQPDTIYSYTESVVIKVVKGVSGSYVDGQPYILRPGSALPIETGVPLTGTSEYRIYIDDAASNITTTPNILVTGYVHTRITT